MYARTNNLSKDSTFKVSSEHVDALQAVYGNTSIYIQTHMWV